MPTIRQRKLAEAIVKNSKLKNPKNKKELIISSGYGKVTAESNSTAVFQQKGVIEVLNDYGFNVDNAKKVVGNIMLDEEADKNSRLKASDMVFKVHGVYAPEKSVNLNINENSRNNPELESLREQFNKKAKEDIISKINEQ